MKRFFEPLLGAAALLFLMVFFFPACPLWAHGSGWSQERAYTVTLSFYYADQTPMAYCEVTIFSPADDKIPYQKGRGDRKGFFSFKPDHAGLWKFSAADGQGHLSRGEIEVVPEQLGLESPAAADREPGLAMVEVQPELARGGAPAGGPKILNIILGLSLFGNIVLFYFWRKAGRTR